ncbi:Ribonuclease P protein component [bacterium HR20]|nr:Ribonuclease P protein component [bacterium HR20]
MSARQLVPLRGHAATEELVRRGKRWRDPSGRVQVIALPRAESPLLCYIVIVSRAICPRAVGRNRIRRLLRESLRKIANDHPELVAPYSAIALRWLAAAPVRECKRLRLGDVLPAVRAALQKPLSPQ